MQTRTVEHVESWESRPFSGGYGALHDLADDSFSGAVVADGVWLFMLNGRVVGVFEGSVEDFEDASGTVYEAPHLSLPLLFAMVETGGESRGTYYTEDTPLSEIHETLTDGNFVGYVELSENVLSGDYYTVYYGGRSMSAAFVGASETLLSGEEAFERAAGEVGLYEVVAVDVDVVDLPERPEPESESAGGAAAVADSGDESSADADTDAEDAGAEAADASTDEDAHAEANGDADEPDEELDDEPTSPATAVGAAELATETRAAESTEPTDTDADEESDESDAPDVDESAWEETAGVSSDEDADEDEVADEVADEDEAEKEEEVDGDAEDEETDAALATTVDETDDADLEAAIAAREERIEDLESTLEDREAELERRADELARLRDERDDLAARVEELEASGEAGGSPSDGSGGLSRSEALAGTNLFVRYESKARPTLDAIGDGDATAEAINENLRLEHHTRFDATDLTVDGEPFEQFLESSAPYRFVSWVVRALPHEILDTGHRNGMSKLFEAVAQVDRAELDGTITVRDEAGAESAHTFDVVLRDRMGDPLVVADIEESRDPVAGEAMEQLVESARSVATAEESLAGAAYVTASFFEPDALEVADAAADSGGFFGGSDRDSYVKVERKRGFHLCLVEDRNETFHITVPQL